MPRVPPWPAEGRPPPSPRVRGAAAAHPAPCSSRFFKTATLAPDTEVGPVFLPLLPSSSSSFSSSSVLWSAAAGCRASSRLPGILSGILLHPAAFWHTQLGASGTCLMPSGSSGTELVATAPRAGRLVEMLSVSREGSVCASPAAACVCSSESPSLPGPAASALPVSPLLRSRCSSLLTGACFGLRDRGGGGQLTSACPPDVHNMRETEKRQPAQAPLLLAGLRVGDFLLWDPTVPGWILSPASSLCSDGSDSRGPGSFGCVKFSGPSHL